VSWALVGTSFNELDYDEVGTLLGGDTGDAVAAAAEVRIIKGLCVSKRWAACFVVSAVARSLGSIGKATSLVLLWKISSVQSALR